jgi:hypothetical protein
MSRPIAKIPPVIDSTEVMRPVVAELQRELSLRRLLEEYLAGHQSKHQGLIDAILRCILNGEDPRPILDLPPRRSGIKPDDAREFTAVNEVARLVREGHDHVEVMHQVAETFGVSVRTVERWCRDHDYQNFDVDGYVRILRGAQLL